MSEHKQTIGEAFVTVKDEYGNEINLVEFVTVTVSGGLCEDAPALGHMSGGGGGGGSGKNAGFNSFTPEQLAERDAVRDARIRAKERERCAKVADGLKSGDFWERHIAAAIRAMGDE